MGLQVGTSTLKLNLEVPQIFIRLALDMESVYSSKTLTNTVTIQTYQLVGGTLIQTTTGTLCLITEQKIVAPERG